MVITGVRSFQAPDISAYAWRGLNHFQNVDHAANTIMRLHGLPEKHRSNARKQAEQLKYCLTQAKEYFIAADAVSLATRPVLLYYGVMSLALAEVLLKQSSDSRLSKLRADHNCHGLSLVLARSPGPNDDLSTTLNSLRAKPQISQDGTPKGTFEVWRRSAREYPIGGVHTTHNSQGTIKRFSMLYGAEDAAPPPQPTAGITLRSCVQNLPYMRDTLVTWGISLDMVRATVSCDVGADSTSSTTIILHPNLKALLDRFMQLPRLRAEEVNNVDVVELENGYIIKSSEKNRSLILPQAICLNEHEVYFSCTSNSIGEFGHTFVALHILGNFARYYPDVWMDHIAKSSALATVVDDLCSQARERLPLLSLSEMQRTYIIPER